MKKQHYETPTTDVLVVRFEDSILNTGSPVANGTNRTEYLYRGDTDDDVDIL